MGFVEGEGCFNIAIQRELGKNRKTGRTNKMKKPGFPFRVRASFRVVCVEADRHILDEIKGQFGVGQIYVQKREEKKNNERNIAHYYVQSMADLVKIQEFFDKQLFYANKGKDFKLWANCLEIMRSGGHLTEEGFLQICELRSKMNFRLAKKPMWKLAVIREVLMRLQKNTRKARKERRSIHNLSSAVEACRSPEPAFQTP